MRAKTVNIVERARITKGEFATSPEDGNNGFFTFKRNGHTLKVIVSDGGGWDHISVSLKGRCPTWAEMCFIKQLFFDDDETVVQYHPKKSEYVNCHPFTLHLWKYQDFDFKMPPSIFVGPK